MDPHAVTANGLEFGYYAAGPIDGPLVLCLHGFPDSPHCWRFLLPDLAEAGYRAVAPFMRGYSPTQLPADGNYQVGALARDVNALHEALGGGGDAMIIGHDWGALAAYAAVAHEPERWCAAVTMAVPPPAAVAASFFTYAQLRRSWYTFFFQSPLAELALPMDDFSFLDHLWAEWSPGYDATYDLSRVKDALGDQDHITAAITYYRALYNAELHDPALAAEQAAGMLPMPVLTLYLHGAGDGCFALDAIGNPLEFLPEGSKLRVIDDAGHFLHVEKPEIVNPLVLQFLEPTIRS